MTRLELVKRSRRKCRSSSTTMNANGSALLSRRTCEHNTGILSTAKKRMKLWSSSKCADRSARSTGTRKLYGNLEMETTKPVQTDGAAVTTWFKAARVSDFPANGGACVRYRNLQIAVFNFSRRNEWYACQNQCPHKMQMVLSRGLIGSQEGEPKV